MIDRKELVEKMGRAYVQGVTGSDPCQLGDSVTRGIDRSLSVAVEELLKDLDDDERDMAYVSSGLSGCQELVMRRRAQLERVKTPEERVTVVEWLHDTSKWVVLIDGWNAKDSATFDKKDRRKADTYRLGLIQQLKGSA